MAHLNLVIAFAAGVLGFFSPCIVPLIPGYLSFVSGVSLAELQPSERAKHVRRVVLATAIFVLGFSIIFTGLGASASIFGAFVLGNRLLLTRIGGVIVILLGLSMLGVIKIPTLSRERRMHLTRRPATLLGALPVGMAFGFAWTPCVGPAQRHPHAGGHHAAGGGRGGAPVCLLAGARHALSDHGRPPQHRVRCAAVGRPVRPNHRDGERRVSRRHGRGAALRPGLPPEQLDPAGLSRAARSLRCRPGRPRAHDHYQIETVAA